MKPDAFTIPNGQSPRKVRDFLSWGNSQECFSGRSVASHFGADITEGLIATGLIEPFSHRCERKNDLFQVSDLGSRLANIRLLPRIDRAKAEGMVDAFLDRVRQVNARAELLYRVVKVNAFGSFITDAPDLGDIDLAIAMQGKQDEIRKAGGEWIATLLARAEAAGKRMRSRSEMLFYGELEVRRLLEEVVIGTYRFTRSMRSKGSGS